MSLKRVFPSDLPYLLRKAMDSPRLRANVRRKLRESAQLRKLLEVLESEPLSIEGSRSSVKALMKLQARLSSSGRYSGTSRVSGAPRSLGPVERFIFELRAVEKLPNQKEQCDAMVEARLRLEAQVEAIEKSLSRGRGRPFEILDVELWYVVNQAFLKVNSMKQCKSSLVPYKDSGPRFLRAIYDYLVYLFGVPPVGHQDRADAREMAMALRRIATPCLRAMEMETVQVQLSTDRDIRRFVAGANSKESFGPESATHFVMAEWHGMCAKSVERKERESRTPRLKEKEKKKKPKPKPRPAFRLAEKIKNIHLDTGLSSIHELEIPSKFSFFNDTCH